MEDTIQTPPQPEVKEAEITPPVMTPAPETPTPSLPTITVQEGYTKKMQNLASAEINAVLEKFSMQLNHIKDEVSGFVQYVIEPKV